MTQLYPLLMSPAFDPRPWGTLDLAPIYPNAKFNEKIGEAWLTGDDCVVTNGALGNRKLADLSKEFGAELVGIGSTRSAALSAAAEVFVSGRKAFGAGSS